MSHEPGLFVAVVGASGAGKDSIIAGARRQLARDPRIEFVRRVITRAPDPDGENHLAVTPEEFHQMAAFHRFALQWEAHGLSYAIPSTAFDAVDHGLVAVANLSRRSLPELAVAGLPYLIVEIVTAPDILAQRLAARGRESADDIRARLSREAAVPAGLNVTRLANDGALSDAISDFVRLLRDRA